MNYEPDRETFFNFYMERGGPAVAWIILGWETVPNEDTAWSGQEERTGRVVACMVGDDKLHIFNRDDLTILQREKFCGMCGQIGCQHDALERA